RRAIVFTGDKAKKVKDDKPAGGGENKDAEKKSEAPPAGSEEPKAAEAPAEGTGDPPPVPPKQGGCGCRVVGEPEPGALPVVFALVSGAAALARRRRVSAARAERA